MRVIPRALGGLIKARHRAHSREIFLTEIRETLEQWAERSVELDPFPHGTFHDQMRFEVNTLAIKMGDPLAIARRVRRNKKISDKTRRYVYQRDKHTCQECGWTRPSDIALREKQYRSGRFLTIDHLVPLAEGGENRWENMQTLCSFCNSSKGKSLPNPSAMPA